MDSNYESYIDKSESLTRGAGGPEGPPSPLSNTGVLGRENGGHEHKATARKVEIDVSILPNVPKSRIGKKGTKVFFDCPECKKELEFDLSGYLKICDRCGCNVDRRPTLPKVAGLKIDWVTVTYTNCDILGELEKLKPLEASDLKYIEHEKKTRAVLDAKYGDGVDDERLSKNDAEIKASLCPWYMHGLKNVGGKIQFYNNAFEWFRGAIVGVGSQGNAGVEDGKAKKSLFCMIKMPGKALDHMRSLTGMSDYELLYFLWIRGGNFSRLDWAIDTFPSGQEKGIIEQAEKSLMDGSFTTTSKLDRSPPKIIKSLDYQGKSKDWEDLKRPEVVTECVYIGSRKSETFARIYDKRRELMAAGFRDPGCRWERFEIELKKKRSQGIVDLIFQSAGVSAALGNEAEEPPGWKKIVLGLFRRFFAPRRFNGEHKRLKDSPLAEWYSDLIEAADVVCIPIIPQQVKDRQQHLEGTLSQTSKRIFKILCCEYKEGGRERVGAFLNSMIKQAFEGMLAKDWVQLQTHIEKQTPGKEGLDESVKMTREFIDRMAWRVA